MADLRTVQRCRWAEPTLFLDDLSWTEADAYPWSCRADGDPQVVTDTKRCQTCGRWAPRRGCSPDECDCSRFRR